MFAHGEADEVVVSEVLPLAASSFFDVSEIGLCTVSADKQPKQNAAARAIEPIFKIDFFIISHLLNCRGCLLCLDFRKLFAHLELNWIHTQLDVRTGNALLAAYDFGVLND